MRQIPASSALRKEISIFSVICAATLAGVAVVSRLGFGFGELPAIRESLAISLFLVLGPDLARRLAVCPDGTSPWYCADGFFLLLGLGLVAMLGWSGQYLLFRPIYLIEVAAAIGLLLALRDWSSPALGALSAWLVGGFVLLSLWVAGIVWDAYYMHPLLLEGLATGRGFCGDTLMHAAIAGMLKTYGAVATGLDGLVRMPYHCGSHWVFAQMARLTGTTPFEFYQMGYAIIFVPWLFRSVLAFSADLRKLFHREEKAGWLYWGIIPIFCVGLLRQGFADSIGIWSQSKFVSQSYLMATAVSFSFLSMLAHWGARAPARDKALSSSDWIFLFVVAPLMAGAIGMTKISLVALIFPAVAYLVLRTPRLWRLPVLISLCLTLLSCAGVHRYALNLDVSAPVMAFAFIRKYVISGWGGAEATWRVVMHLVFFHFWTLAFVAFEAWRLRIAHQPTRREAIRSRETVGAELALFVAALGAIPGFVLDIPGGSALYFSDFQSWISLAFILFRLPDYAPLISAAAMKAKPGPASMKWALRAGTIVLGWTLLGNLWRPVGSLVRGNVRMRSEMLQNLGEKEGKGLPSTELRAALERSPGFVVLQALRELNALAEIDKGHSLLFIPRENTAYWRLLRPCRLVPFVGPAVSGLALLDGLPEPDCRAQMNGYERYDMRLPKVHVSLSEKNSIPRLCAMVRSRGMDRLIVLMRDPSGAAYRRFVCRPVSEESRQSPLAGDTVRQE